MSRRNRLLIWLGSLLALVGLAYASLPWLLVTVARHYLVAQGFHDIQLRIDYPDWHSVRLHELAVSTDADGQLIHLQVPSAEIEYHLGELVMGRLDHIRIPVATLRIQPAPRSAIAIQAKASAALPLAALVSGQWLLQVPVDELSLDRLNVTLQSAKNIEYALRSSAQFKNEQLQLNGVLNLPPLPQPMKFSFNARSDGKAYLNFVSTGNGENPLLTVAVTSVDVDQEAIKVNGNLRATLNNLAPLMKPWLQQLKQVSGIDGELDSQWQAHINASSWQLSGDATLHGLAGQWRELAMPASEVSARFVIDPQQATLHASLSTAGQAVVLQADGVHQFASGYGHAELRLLPVVFSNSGFKLSQLQKTWTYPFDVDSGRASAAVQLQWDRILKTEADLRLDKLGGHYNKITFSGITSEMALAMNDGIATRKTAHVHVDSLDVGFPVENIAVQFALMPAVGTDLPVVKVHKFNATLLGGMAHAGPFTLDFTRDKNTFEVQLEHIGLHEIMLLEQQEGLAGSGVLDGKIPINISRKGVEVVNGQLDVRAPGGIIRYTPTDKVASLAQSNPNVDMVVEALRNFHYEIMDVRSDYQTSGDLKLQVHLEGKNPDWQAGKPVHLNLNLQENIPALLRSLQLSGEISERLRQHYQNTH